MYIIRLFQMTTLVEVITLAGFDALVLVPALNSERINDGDDLEKNPYKKKCYKQPSVIK
jgi:hypothetical protein